MWANRNAIAHLVLLAMAYGATAYQCDCTGRSNCMCPSLEAPGGMDPSDIPQFILFTHDDGIVPLTERSFRDVADSRQNPNGCPVRATMFTTSQDTDCDLAYGMWRDGYEIATHTADHTQMPEGFPKNDTLSEILGAKQFLTRQCGIPEEEIRGFRSPFLVTNPTVRQVLWENGFLYDSTLLEAVDSESVSTSMADRVWPYTLDFGIAQNCAWFSDTQTCKAAERWPGLWEVPLWVLKVLGLEFTMDVGFYGGRGVYEPLKAAFDAAYSGNRAPVPIYVHTTWVEKQPSRLDELKEFADYTLEKGDVYWVTMAQLLAWMKNPVPASQLRKSKAMCAPPQAAQPTPQLPLNGANVTLTFKGASQTQVADQQQRLVAAVAELLGTAAADTFVVGTAGGPAAQNAVSAQSLEDGSHVQVTVAASGADPMALYQHAVPQATRDALDAQLSAMGFEASGEAIVVPFRNGVALPTGAPAAAPVLAPTPAPAPVRVPGPAPAAMPAAKPAASPAAAVAGPVVVTEPAAAPTVVTPATTTSGDSTAATALPAAPGSAATTSSSGSGLSAGAIAGIAVGGVLIAVLIGVAVWTLAGWRLRRSPSDKHLAASSVGEPGSSRTSFTSSRGSPRKGSRNGSPTKKGGCDKLDIVASAV